MSKKKINKGFLIADQILTDVRFVNENVMEFQKNDGKPGYLAEVKMGDAEDSELLFMDGGLRGALKQAKILNKEGTMIAVSDKKYDIVPTGKKELEEGFVYTYDILA